MLTLETSHGTRIGGGWRVPDLTGVVGERVLDAVAIGTVLNDAPREAAQTLGLSTVLASRVMEDGAWVPWARYGEAPTSEPDQPAWPVRTSGLDMAREDPTAATDDIHPAVAIVLARAWVLAPIECHGRLMGFLHANPGIHEPGGTWTTSSESAQSQPLWMFAEQLTARCEEVERTSHPNGTEKRQPHTRYGTTMSITHIIRDHAELHQSGVLLPVLRRALPVFGPDLALVDRADGQLDLYRVTDDHDALVGGFSTIGEIWHVVDEIDTA